MIDLKNCATCDLVNELAIREGVSCRVIEPHDDRVIRVLGPAVVLIIED